MFKSATPPLRCYSPVSLPLDATFDAPRLTSDGGVVWVAEADDRLGLCSALAAAISDWRTGAFQCFDSTARLTRHRERLELHTIAFSRFLGRDQFARRYSKHSRDSA
jgi:hypothetical protein